MERKGNLAEGKNTMVINKRSHHQRKEHISALPSLLLNPHCGAINYRQCVARPDDGDKSDDDDEEEDSKKQRKSVVPSTPSSRAAPNSERYISFAY